MSESRAVAIEVDEALAQSPSPRWIRYFFFRAWADVAGYARTWAGICFQPARFATRWMDGTGRYMNPLAFLGISAAILSSAEELGLTVIFGIDMSGSWIRRFVVLGSAPPVEWGLNIPRIIFRVVRIHGVPVPMIGSAW